MSITTMRTCCGTDTLSPHAINCYLQPILPVDPVCIEKVHKVGEDWHKIDCDGKCGAIAGCATQWQPDEVAQMQRKSLTFGAGKPDESHPMERCAHCGARPGVHQMGCPILTGKPALRELTSAERKAAPVVTGVLHYFPDAIMAIARVSKAGNDKHNPGEPLHWARGKSNDHLDSEGRHLLTPGAMDPDSGQPEGAHKAWRALADLQIAEEKRLIAAGIRPLSGVTE